MSREDYPDIEVAVMDLLEQAVPDLARAGGRPHVDEEPPADLPAFLGLHPAFAAVSRIDGGDDKVTDVAVLDVEVYAPTRADARRIAEQIRTLMLRYPHRVGEGAAVVILDRVFTETAPRRLPWADENTHRFGGTYRVSARR